MDRRGFLQTAGLGVVVATVGTPAVSTLAAEPEPSSVKQLPKRSEVPVADTWDLSSLFPNDEAWEKAFAAWTKRIDGYAAFPGKLAEGPKSIAACIQFDLDLSRASDRLGVYAMLKSDEDQGDSVYQRMKGRFEQAASRAGQASSFIRPEILAIPAEKMAEYLKAPELAPFKLLLTRILRFKPHTLNDSGEKLLAMQAEMAMAPNQIFGQISDTDLKFGVVENEKGEQVELSHSVFLALQNCPNREVRATAFHTYYKQYDAFQHAISAVLNSAVQRDVYYAKARNYPSALEAALFPDNVPVSVYNNLIDSVHRQLPALHRYYDVRKRKMGLSEIHFYDTFVPMFEDVESRHTWDEAVKLILPALKPLGDEYCTVLDKGLKSRWCDRYENRGKKSGAFSNGSFDGNPYILINFQPNVLDSVFTLAHEAGHSMHSYFSAKTQPYAYYDYTLFVAEVASTFNEMLLGKYLLDRAKDKKERAFLLNRQIDSMRATIFRQTMFAEFEKLIHASVESGEPLTTDRFRELYHGLLTLYLGPNFAVDPDLSLECLRIPHFYRTFYVYKYATGMSASMALADRVTGGGKKELDDYLNFLKGGCSKDPLDLLRAAGVDMEKPSGVDRALAKFGRCVEELDSLVS
jgi:oligoendopeptidase F